jgi:hypothetical protein
MPPSRRRGANKAKANAHFKLGDLVLARVKGFPAWPAKVRFHSSNLFLFLLFSFYIFLNRFVTLRCVALRCCLIQLRFFKSFSYFDSAF